MTVRDSAGGSRRRAQAWFPGRYVPVSHIHGVEILDRPRTGVRVDRTTIHGTADELRVLAVQMLKAANAMDRPRPIAPRAAA